MSKSTLHLDLHPIAKNGSAISQALDELFAEAKKKRAKTAEIIPGKVRKPGRLLQEVASLFDVRKTSDNLNSGCKPAGS